MREFKCASLGNMCSWEHLAKTEERLTDVVAVHLRDVHGVTSLNPEMLTKIRNAFSVPEPLEAKKAEGLVMREFHCKDLGNDCPWKYIAQTEDLIVDGAAVHMRKAHGVTDFTQEMKVKVAKALREWKG